ncbi:MAG: NAD(P)-dependent oxidoreductase [Candidatus Woesearchaeota archaeon]|jgi:D-lactate dehydrogenase
MKIVFFDLEDWEIDYFKKRILNQEVEYYKTEIEDTLYDSAFDAELISSFVFSKLDKKTLDKFKNLKFIATMSTGFDHIDLTECEKRKIKVCNVPSYGENTVAEHTFGLILSLSRNIYKAYQVTSKGKFSYEGLMGFDLKGKTIGILGTGKIGQNVIKIAKGFNMNVIAYDPHPKEDVRTTLGFTYVSFNELLATSDIVSIHVPLNSHTYHLFNTDSMQKMKTGAMLINTSRGPIVDTNALLEALNTKKLGSAGLDVLEGEMLMKEEKAVVSQNSQMAREQMATLLEDYALMRMNNVIITPHLAFYSKEAVTRILDSTLDNLFDFIENRNLRNKVEIKPD